MWDHLVTSENGQISVQVDQSFFCGDVLKLSLLEINNLFRRPAELKRRYRYFCVKFLNSILCTSSEKKPIIRRLTGEFLKFLTIAKFSFLKTICHELFASLSYTGRVFPKRECQRTIQTSSI